MRESDSTVLTGIAEQLARDDPAFARRMERSRPHSSRAVVAGLAVALAGMAAFAVAELPVAAMICAGLGVGLLAFVAWRDRGRPAPAGGAFRVGSAS